jgi:major membrane immunogen (membrane-anchored lipoprotein)
MTGPHVLGRTVSLAAAICLVAGCLVFLGATGASAQSTTYYVDNTAACPGSGTEASPWCDFSVVNSTTFQPGDQILLKRGDIFTSEMVLYGSGTSTSYVTVGAYGPGPGPVINGDDNTSFIGINLYNDSYVEVEDISVEDAGTGILINDATDQTGYRFLYLYFGGNSVGIQGPGGSDSNIASNVLVQDVTGESNTLGCSPSNNCLGDTLELGGTSQVIVDRMYSAYNCGAAGWGIGPGASDVVVENSESVDIITGVPNNGGVDLSGIDVEPQDSPDSGINIEDNYIADNAGPGIEILDHPSAITNLDISGNVLSDNADDYGTVPYPLWGQIWTDVWEPNSVEATGSIENNLYDAPASTGGFEEIHGGANLNGFTQSNNIDVSGQGNVSFAANGFSCTTQGANGWSYQTSTNNSTWTNLSGCSEVDTLDQEWTTGGTASGFVSNFEELPPSTSTSWAARSWTAPASGSVSIRGRVLMSDPTCASGVTAEITQNGSSTPIWGPQAIAAGNDVGVDANLDGVSVNAGDVLHFAVQENGSSQCRVSWTPSVATPNPVSTVVIPKSGANLDGTELLDASANDPDSPISSVQYLVSGGSLNDYVIATGHPTYYGWLANWNTTTEPDGTYTLQSMATDAAGNVAYSAGVTVVLDNSFTTSVLIPSSGSFVSGSQVVLDGAAPDNVSVTSVQYLLSGGSLHDEVIGTGTPTYYGWLAYFNSTTVPDGTYTLQSEATDSAGNERISTPINIIVENSPPTTSMLIPSNGASVSGAQVLLDASGNEDVAVTKVQFYLTGGSLNNVLVASGQQSKYGWLAYFNSTTVPDGTYTMQSEAYDGAGAQALSTPISITVAN